MGQGEGRQPADPEALVLPGQHVVGQVDFLVDHGELDLRVLTAHHLGGGGGGGGGGGWRRRRRRRRRRGGEGTTAAASELLFYRLKNEGRSI